MKTIECVCGRSIRPCNARRHMVAKHMPKAQVVEWGTVAVPPPNPIKLGKDKDRRNDGTFPRGEGPHRYRIYRVRAGDLQIVGTAATAQKMGEGLAFLHSIGKFIADDSVGVLDTIADPGHWVINPWTLGRKASDG